jgi:ESX secretion system ATPase EccB
MASRRDQLQSYQFLLQRVISSLVMRETDPFQSPLRRGTGAIFAGVMIAVIVAAVYGVVGILTKSGADSWKQNGAVIVEKETGGAFVYKDGVLHPTLNYTSALLAGSKGIQLMFREPAASLDDVPVGTTLGIPNAPTSLPSSDDQIQDDWSLCSGPGRDPSGNPEKQTTLVVGTSLDGGATLLGRGLLVKDSDDGSDYLVWRDRKYPITDPNSVITPLFNTQTLATTRTSWLDVLPAGKPIEVPSVPDAGTPSDAISGYNNGDLLFDKTANGPQYWLVYSDGLASLTKLQEDLVTASGEQPQEISVTAAQDAQKSGQLPHNGGESEPPDNPPQLETPVYTDNICATFSSGNSTPVLSVGGTYSGLGKGVPSNGTTPDGTPLADNVAVLPGHVVVVKSMASDTATTGAYNLVTDAGKRYPIPYGGVLDLLGYDTGKIVKMPGSLIARIPPGPTLDPKMAKKVAKG